MAQRINITPELIKPIIDQLLNYKVLIATNGSKPGLLPAQPPEVQKVIDILRVVRKAEEHSGGSVELLPKFDTIEILYEKMNSALDQGFGDVTLKDISLTEQDTLPADTAQSSDESNKETSAGKTETNG